MSVGTRGELLKIAEVQLRSKGYSAFSYADLAVEVGIRKASIHHHFPTKEKLGEELLKEYIARFTNTLSAIEESFADPVMQLKQFAHLFHASINDGLLPLCGALAAEMSELPVSLKSFTRMIFEMQIDWLEKSLGRAVQMYGWSLTRPPREYAFMLLSILEGVSFVEWTLGASGDPLAGFNYLLGTLA